MQFGIHKDRKPAETIRKIRDILNDLEISTYERQWAQGGENLYSVRIEDALLTAGTNGKGVSHEYALASAYAEFMERIQNAALYFDSFIFMEKKFVYPDAVTMGIAEYIKKNKNLVSSLTGAKDLDKIAGKKDIKMQFVPYYNVFAGRAEYLPHEFVWQSSGTNGMCAGNTPAEAICQGLCEIFERYMIKQLYEGAIEDVPNIPLSAVKEFDIYNIIEEITDRGHHLIIKDFTMAGKLPVLGVLLLTPESDKYRMSCASDVLFETTIQRCLSELYQGIDSGSIRNYMNRLDMSDNQFQAREFSSDHRQKLKEKKKALATQQGQLPNHIFFCPSFSSGYQAAFLDKFTDHKKSLQFLLQIVKSFGWELFIRDVSFLGFPAYKIFIPKVSPTTEFIDDYYDINELISLMQMREKVKKTFRLPQLDNEELAEVADTLEILMDCPRYPDLRKGTLLPLRLGFFKEDADINSIDTEILLVLIYNRLGNYEKAFYYLDQYLKHKRENNIEIDNPEYYQGALLFFKMKTKKFSKETIVNSLLTFSGQETAREILNDLSDPAKSFQYYQLPECGDCKKCPAVNQCHFPKWSDIVTRLNEKMKKSFPDQVESLAFLQQL